MSKSDAYYELPHDQSNDESEQAYGATSLMDSFESHAPVTRPADTDEYDQPWTQNGTTT